MNTSIEQNKKKFYQKWWFWLIIGILIGLYISPNNKKNEKTTTETSTEIINNTTKETTEAVVIPTTESTTEVTTEATTEQSEEDAVNEMGQNWFMNIDWEKVFPYKSDIHYIIGYSCQKTNKDFKKYGKYVATASADLQNAFGAEFESTIYIFMDKKGVAKHIFYDEADGTTTEIDMDTIPMKIY